ncbi:hypothetical protein DXG03_000837 [Asterophora parasitica]|uniref:DNA 3'-5' helicase n=1 Tax=Asterophora parasitica TaxID=117018 RepID=A0A9P7GDE5_9AGAR|nr:hypothetical protein DXG03_000837 [Asterophora parasitica]
MAFNERFVRRSQSRFPSNSEEHRGHPMVPVRQVPASAYPEAYEDWDYMNEYAEDIGPSYNPGQTVDPDYGDEEFHGSSNTTDCREPPMDVGDDGHYSQPPRGSNPRNAHGIRLRPVSSLQLQVISAPTGSGKTVLFELAIIRMLTESANTDGSLKCVYMAPTKALCSERYRDWTAKFDPLGIKCAELTGDTVHFGRGVWGDAKKASIMSNNNGKSGEVVVDRIPSLTFYRAKNGIALRAIGFTNHPYLFAVTLRRLSLRREHSQILSKIHLFLIDEVHILNESRGSTLEVVVSRMKTRGSAVRFVLVSATVPNIEDIASWIASSNRPQVPAKVFVFGEEFRPCKLTRHVIGVHRQKGQNDFVFTKNLDYKLFGALQQYSVGKPILVFCSTRKDKDGIALIFCEEELENKYRALVQGQTILESSLHANLSEHLNSEVGLGTITSISTAKEWLRGTFLFQRIRKNPKHYALGKDNDQTWEEKVDDLVMQSVEKLRETQLVESPTDGSGDQLISTDYGDIMSKVCFLKSIGADRF